jgi:hypothetical protein
LLVGLLVEEEQRWEKKMLVLCSLGKGSSQRGIAVVCCSEEAELHAVVVLVLSPMEIARIGEARRFGKKQGSRGVGASCLLAGRKHRLLADWRRPVCLREKQRVESRLCLAVLLGRERGRTVWRRERRWWKRKETEKRGEDARGIWRN